MSAIQPASQEELVEKAGQAILYAVMDAADAPAVPEYLESVDPSCWRCLYQGKSLRDYWAVAPYLVQVTEGLLEWIAENLDHNSWGILLQSAAGLNGTYSHLRKLHMTRNPDGRIYYFRYYDPRILGLFLTILTADQSLQLFGPIEAFFYSNGEQLLKALAPASATRATETATLNINQSQVTEFQNLSFSYYVQRVNDHLAMEIPNHWDGQSPESHTLLRKLITQGQAMGLQSERALSAFTEQSVLTGRTPGLGLQQRQILRVLEDEAAMQDWPTNRSALVNYLRAANDAV